MIDLEIGYFTDTEIISLLQDGSEDGRQTVEDFLYALLSLYELSPQGESLSKSLIFDWRIFADEVSLSKVLDSMGNPFQPCDLVKYKAEYLYYLNAWEDVKNEVKTTTRFFCPMDSIVDILADFDIDSDSLLLF